MDRESQVIYSPLNHYAQDFSARGYENEQERRRRFRSLSPVPRRLAESQKKNIEIQVLETQSQELEPDLPSTQKRHRIERWTPFFLRKRVLVVFAMTFAAIIASLQVLYSYSEMHEGIAASDNGKHYLWTFGPTAFFIIITVCWRQVDLAAKSIQPWAELAHGPVTAHQSLLLDYVNPLHVVGMWRSLKNGHVTVGVTILMFFLIKALTIISTGLFDLRLVEVGPVSTDMSLQTGFDASKFQLSSTDDQRSVWNVYADLKYALNFSRGTNDRFAVQSFGPQIQNQAGISSYTATVDVFTSELACDAAQIYYNQTYRACGDSTGALGMSWDNRSYVVPGCQISFPSVASSPGYLQCFGGTSSGRPFASLSQANCSDSGEQRLLLEHRSYNGTGQNETANFTAVICTPSYSIQTGEVTLNPAGQIEGVKIRSDSRQLPNITALNLISQLFAAEMDIPEETTTETDYDTFTVLMMLATQDFDPKSFTNTSYLSSKGSDIYSRLNAQIASQFLLSSTTNSTSAQNAEGSIFRSEQRLLVQSLPTRLMQGITGIMFLMTIVILFSAPRGITPRSLDSIAGIAVVLARSTEFTDLMHNSGTRSTKDIEQILSSHTFRTVFSTTTSQPVFAIQSTSSKPESLLAKRPETGEIDWSSPWILRRWAVCAVIVAPICALGLLEYFLRRSQQFDGIATVEPDSIQRYAWLYIPTLTLVLIATLFNMVDFELEQIHPFYELSRGYRSAAQSLFTTPSKHMSISAAYKAFMTSRYALFAATTSVIFAPLLTIIASGLFFTQLVPNVRDASVDMVSWFNLNGNVSETWSIAGLVVQTNISYPQWTHDELVMPEMQINIASRANGQANAGNLSMAVPCLRARSDCTLVPRDKMINLTMTRGTVTGSVPVPEECANMRGPASADFARRVQANSYFGTSVSLSSPKGFGGNQSTCPFQRAFVYGHMNSTDIDYLQGYLCTASVDLLEANVTFNLPSFSTANSPIIDESTTTNYSNWRQDLDFLTITSNIGPSAVSFDGYLTAMTSGRDPVSLDDLKDPTTFMKQQQHVYRQGVAQILNDNWRVPTSSMSQAQLNILDGGTRNAVVKGDQETLRLIQSELPTRLLQAVLGILLICAVVIVLLVDVRRVLPKPMGSIAALASLLVDSRIVDPKYNLTPAGSEFLSDDTLKKEKLWGDELFKLCWWEDRDGDDSSGMKHDKMDDSGLHKHDGVDGVRRRFGIDSKPRCEVDGVKDV